jgi:hypothetical protein
MSLKVIAALSAVLLATPALAQQRHNESSHAPVATNSTFNTAYSHALGGSRDPADRLGPTGVVVRD